eukprot:jgi/Tetstr1/445560/TSEL_033333.t1
MGCGASKSQPGVTAPEAVQQNTYASNTTDDHETRKISVGTTRQEGPQNPSQERAAPVNNEKAGGLSNETEADIEQSDEPSKTAWGSASLVTSAVTHPQQAGLQKSSSQKSTSRGELNFGKVSAKVSSILQHEEEDDDDIDGQDAVQPSNSREDDVLVLNGDDEEEEEEDAFDMNGITAPVFNHVQGNAAVSVPEQNLGDPEDVDSDDPWASLQNQYQIRDDMGSPTFSGRKEHRKSSKSGVRAGHSEWASTMAPDEELVLDTDDVMGAIARAKQAPVGSSQRAKQGADIAMEDFIDEIETYGSKAGGIQPSLADKLAQFEAGFDDDEDMMIQEELRIMSSNNS